MDFSIKLIPKILNYKKSRQSPIKIHITKLERVDSDEKLANRSFEEKPSKLSLFKKAIKAVNVLNKLKAENAGKQINKITEIKKAKSHLDPQNVEEGHVEVKEDDNFLTQNHPSLKKTITVGKFERMKKEQEQEQENKKKLKAQHSEYVFGKKNRKKPLTLQEIITSERNIRKMKTIKTEEIFLEPTNYNNYLSEFTSKGKKVPQRETFCEGFFIASFPKKDGQVVEKSQSFPASCGHEECSSLPAMKPEIILRYPLEDTKTLEMNNLAATICFPTGIKVCYSKDEPEMIKDYVTPITNQKGERYYMMTYHFYLKMANEFYYNIYEMHPLRHHLMKFADNYLNMDELDKETTEQIQKKLEKVQDLGFRDYVYIPFCICLISKYPYVKQMKKCLQSIYNLIINKDILSDKNKLNYLIMHIINSVPIPDLHNTVHFFIPFFSEGIEIRCPKLNDLKIMNSTLSDLLKLFTIDYITIIFRLILFEKKILFIDDDYTRLSNVTDNFISLLYPFQWVHTYIPIMSDQMLKYLETFLPFLNGINSSLMPLVKELFECGEMEESDEMFLIEINESKLKLGSTLIGKNVKKYKYIEDNVPALPINLEKDLKNKLKSIKDEIDSFQKNFPDDTDLSDFDFKIRNAFIEMFVQMFSDIDKYMCYLDEDVVFNKNLFMETIPKEDKQFYEEFIDTQLFQLFCQNFVKDELNYFKNKLSDYNKSNNFSEISLSSIEQKGYIKKIYIIKPDYLDINYNNKEKIEDIISKKFFLNEETDIDGFIINNKKITEYMEKIDNNNYNNKNCNIYLIPDKENENNKFNLLSDILTTKKSGSIVMNQFVKYMRTRSNISELSEKEQDAIKEKIKDFTVKIFKSEEIEANTNLKKDLQNDLNTNIGREFFVSLLSKNTSNIILLTDKSFDLLGTLIYNTLLFILQVEETIKILRQIVILIKSTRHFAKEVKETVGYYYFLSEEKKNTITLWNIYKQKIAGYPKVNQANLWNKWFEINLDNEKENLNDEIKKQIILKLCILMIELELNKPFIKNTIEGMVKKAFENDEEKIKVLMEEIVQKIINAKYISKVTYL